MFIYFFNVTIFGCHFGLSIMDTGFIAVASIEIHTYVVTLFVDHIFLYLLRHQPILVTA